MQNNKIIQVVMFMLLLLLSMWAMSALLEVRAATRNIILGVGFFAILLSVLWRKIPLDAKLLFICILGYALGGKGFAYLSPAKPFFIGEISIALCALGFLLRWKQWGLLDTAIHKWIWVYLIYAGIHLQLDYHFYRLDAIRDSATAYYSLFFLAAFVIFRDQRLMETFEKVLKVVVVFAIIGGVVAVLARRFGISLYFTGFKPHGDGYMPLLVGVTLLFLVKSLEQKKLHYLVIAIAAAGIVISIKVAGLVMIAAVICVAILWGRLKALIVPGVIAMMAGAIVVSIAIMINPEFFVDNIASGEVAGQFGVEGGEFVGFSGTSEWRLNWWTNIWRNTMRIAPFWGQGFGADITGPFLEEWLGKQADPSGYARYPHSIVFTIIGRLGLVGLFIFGALFITVGIFSLRYCRRFFSSVDRRDADLMTCGIVVAGMVNGLLQATYEIPYGAITHWVCLGYMAARFYQPQSHHGNRDSNTEPGSLRSPEKVIKLQTPGIRTPGIS